MKKKLHRRKMFLGIALLAIVALVLAIPTLGASLAIPLAFVCAPKVATGLATLCAASPFIISRMLLDHRDGDGGDDTFSGDEVTFSGDQAKKIVRGVEKVCADVSRLDKESKRALEDLTKVKQTCNDFSKAINALQKLRVSLDREVRQSFGDPVERLLQDPDKAEFLHRAIANSISRPVGKALGEDTSPGSTLINTELAGEIYDTLASFGVWNTFGVRSTITKLTTFPVKTARSKARWINTESDTITDDTTKAGTSVNCTMKPCAVLNNVSLQLLDDSPLEVVRDVMSDFYEGYNERLDAAIVNGNGVADEDYGGYTGVFGFGTAATAAAGNTTIENLDLDDFVRCLTTVAPAVLGRKSKWWLHPHVLARIVLVRDGNGRPIFQTALEAPAPGAIGSILGYPVVLSHAAPSTNAAGNKIAAFGDPQGYVVGVRRDFVFEASDHHKWNTLQRSFRSFGRAGGIGRRADAFAILTLAAA